MKRHLDTIVELHRALTQLAEAQELLGGIPDWMQELHVEHSGRKAVIDELEVTFDQAAAERRAAEAEIEDAQLRIKKYQEQIGLVRTQREYAALLQEIDTAKESSKLFEEQVFAAMERQDETQQSIASEREQFADLDGRYGRELAKWEAEKPQVAANAEKLEQQATLLREQVPRPYLALFERIFERLGGQALAPVQQLDRTGRIQMWHCGACNYSVRPQVVVDIRNQGSLVQCDACKRILFLEEVAE